MIRSRWRKKAEKYEAVLHEVYWMIHAEDPAKELLDIDRILYKNPDQVTLDLTNEQRAEVVIALLKQSVPPTAIARAFGMEVDHIAGALAMMWVEKYGTDELNEAMVFLIWEAVDEAHRQIRQGSPANKARFVQMILSRSIALAGKSSPELAEKVRSALETMARDTAPAVRLQDSIYTPTE